MTNATAQFPIYRIKADKVTGLWISCEHTLTFGTVGEWLAKPNTDTRWHNHMGHPVDGSTMLVEWNAV